ncbi:MAG: hypothetical protein IT343_02775 [Candidatus Melainabacteria bacterium]|nr:hypothetical protein [Candidatus Melainabacteria bacterium]
MAKILIVDVDQQILDAVAEVLRQKNYLVETTGSGEDGLERMLISCFDDHCQIK